MLLILVKGVAFNIFLSLFAASNFGFHQTILFFFLFFFCASHAVHVRDFVWHCYNKALHKNQSCDQKKSPRFTARPIWTHSSVCTYHRRSGGHSPGLALTQTGTGLPAWGLAASKQCQTQILYIIYCSSWKRDKWEDHCQNKEWHPLERCTEDILLQIPHLLNGRLWPLTLYEFYELN